MIVPLLDLTQQNAALRSSIEEAIGRVLDSNEFILGSEVATLERELAEFCGVRHAIACASGSDALLLAFMALDVGPGDEVITTAYSFFASVSAITRLGATPVFADIDPISYNIDPADVAQKITPKTKAIEPVHLYGQCADMQSLMAVADSHNLPVVEDAAQAIGAQIGGRQAGSIGAIGCFSFYPSKNLGGMGDGGVLTTDDDGLAAKFRALRVHGADKRYFHKYVGINSRLDGFQGAVLRVKLPHLTAWTDNRRRNAAHYRGLFAEHGIAEGAVSLPFESEDSRHIYNQFVIRVAERRDELRAFLSEKGVGTDIYYPVPLHLQECFGFLGYERGDLPQTERAANETIALPIYPEMTSDQQTYVVESIAEFFASKAQTLHA